MYRNEGKTRPWFRHTGFFLGFPRGCSRPHGRFTDGNGAVSGNFQASPPFMVEGPVPGQQRNDPQPGKGASSGNPEQDQGMDRHAVYGKDAKQGNSSTQPGRRKSSRLRPVGRK